MYISRSLATRSQRHAKEAGTGSILAVMATLQVCCRLVAIKDDVPK